MAASQAVQAKLAFLFTAGHSQFASCPELANFYMQQFQRTADQADVTLADAVQRLQCSHCGALFASGVNCTVRTNNAKSKKSKYRNKISSTCHTCHHRTIAPGATTTALKRLGRPSSDPVKTLIKPAPKPVEAGTKKKPKKKKLDLQAMIKQQTQPSKEKTSFGLDDFLSSL
jgi:RNase P subunit RPR2